MRIYIQLILKANSFFFFYLFIEIISTRFNPETIAAFTVKTILNNLLISFNNNSNH